MGSALETLKVKVVKRGASFRLEPVTPKTSAISQEPDVVLPHRTELRRNGELVLPGGSVQGGTRGAWGEIGFSGRREPAGG